MSRRARRNAAKRDQVKPALPPVAVAPRRFAAIRDNLPSALVGAAVVIAIQTIVEFSPWFKPSLTLTEDVPQFSTMGVKVTLESIAQVERVSVCVLNQGLLRGRIGDVKPSRSSLGKLPIVEITKVDHRELGWGRNPVYIEYVVDRKVAEAQQEVRFKLELTDVDGRPIGDVHIPLSASASTTTKSEVGVTQNAQLTLNMKSACPE